MRRDLDLKRVGSVADLPLTPSPIQLSTEGIWRNHSFVVVGRIIYEYEQGGWNEWHLVFNDGASGWLSDAQDEYAVSVLNPMTGLPAAYQLQRGGQFNFTGTVYEITTITKAHYRGVQGELPFEYWDKTDVIFADLKTHDARFGTLDYSDPQPLLFLGEAVGFDDLHLRNLRQFEGWQ